MSKLRVRGRALFLQGCTAYLYGAQPHTLFTGQRERKREGERVRKMGERDEEYVVNYYFYF
jgi:hypothetical protein